MVHCPLEVAKDVFAVVEVAGGGTVEVFGEDVGDSGQIRTGRCGEPLEGANETLIFGGNGLLLGGGGTLWAGWNR